MAFKDMVERYNKEYEPIRQRVKLIKFGLTLAMVVFIGITIAIIING